MGRFFLISKDKPEQKRVYFEPPTSHKRCNMTKYCPPSLLVTLDCKKRRVLGVRVIHKAAPVWAAFGPPFALSSPILSYL